MTSAPMPDLLRRLSNRPWWHSVFYLVGAIVCFALGVVGWLVPVVTGLPFYVLGFVLLGLAGNRPRKWVNALERRLPEHLRRRMRHALARRAGPRLRAIIHFPDDAAPRTPSG